MPIKSTEKHDISLGSLLAQARLKRGMSQAELARRLSMSPANLSRIEHGTDLRVSTLLDIARELKLEPVLVPKENVSAVRSLLASANRGDETNVPLERGRFT